MYILYYYNIRDATVLKIMLEETDDISESQLAIMVSEVAQEYVYVESTQGNHNLHVSRVNHL